MPCLTAKPIVDGFEKDLEGKAKVVRLNVLSGLGREVAITYGIRGVPSTVVVDAGGEVVLTHTGIPSRKAIVEKATAA
jgi:thiol-disulfide isomerase/thioredoxin